MSTICSCAPQPPISVIFSVSTPELHKDMSFSILNLRECIVSHSRNPLPRYTLSDFGFSSDCLAQFRSLDLDC